ncbi:hypothetical protein CBR67_02915 [Bordetella hinzii]|nr:hypothetical protein AXA74_02960 [Bordetella hinzii LMG 13501]QDJ35683.1 hypothetical protein CBR67_02915 [Bordetella hinzii]
MGARRSCPVDWALLLQTLHDAGYTIYEAGRATRIPRSTIQGWIDGSEPRRQDGETIIALWVAVIRLPRMFVPRLPGKRRTA